MSFKNFSKYITVFLLAMLFVGFTGNCSLAAQKVPTIIVLSDSNHRNGTTYLICGAASDIIASDIINRMNHTGRIKAPLLGDNMSKVTQNLPLYSATFFKEYKYNYNIDFVNLRRLTRNMQADYILMVTSGLDIQSQFLKETWWNKWGISASEPIVPTYRLVTMLTLVDKKSYKIVWQDLYERDIKAKNMDIGVTQFSPTYSQLAKIKKYSNTMSEYVVNNIDKVVNPWIIPPEEPKAVEMKSKFINEGTKVYYPTVNGEVVKENFNEAKQNCQTKINNYKRERAQKKYIENVRRIEQKRQAEEIKQLEQKVNIEKNKEQKKKNDARLFDSIRNNIDDVSNSLPKPKEESQDIIPAVEIQPVDNKNADKILLPVMDKPAAESQEDNVKPIVDKQIKQQVEQPVKDVQQQSSDTDVQKQIPQDVQRKRVPSYDWNIKNIYLQKIGQM